MNEPKPTDQGRRIELARTGKPVSAPAIFLAIAVCGVFMILGIVGESWGYFAIGAVPAAFFTFLFIDSKLGARIFTVDQQAGKFIVTDIFLGKVDAETEYDLDALRGFEQEEYRGLLRIIARMKNDSVIPLEIMGSEEGHSSQIIGMNSRLKDINAAQPRRAASSPAKR
jgi:hypothetical protein